MKQRTHECRRRSKARSCALVLVGLALLPTQALQSCPRAELNLDKRTETYRRPRAAAAGSVSLSMVLDKRGVRTGGDMSTTHTDADSSFSSAAAGGARKRLRIITEQVGPHTVEVVWDDAAGRYIDTGAGRRVTNGEALQGRFSNLQAFLKHSFIPEDVSPDYFAFTRWRVFQRFVAATVNVLGTQALLLALGIKAQRLGAAAAISWVLKDALGKFVRVLWASRMGRRFDSDAKRWRFRSSLLYATGSGLEIVTYVFPALFLVLATVANALKQMSMLTSSATRNTIYRSFARGENIGDITAKGEAQIACTDLLGMLSGILLSKALGECMQ
jgi:Vitamin B6 photo-protection and homoeostasis